MPYYKEKSLFDERRADSLSRQNGGHHIINKPPQEASAISGQNNKDGDFNIALMGTALFTLFYCSRYI